MAGAGVRRVAAARGDPVAVAVGVRGRGTSRRGSPCRGPAPGAAAGSNQSAHHSQTLPDGVEQPEAVGLEGVHRRRARGSRPRSVLSCGKLPCQMLQRCSPPGVSSSPHGIALLLEPAAGGVLPLGLGRQPHARPARSRRARRSRRRARPDGRRGRRVDEPGPSGRRQSAPSTCRHHGRLRHARAWAGSRRAAGRANTNDEPKRSASVRWPVASTNAANSLVGDRVRGDRGTARASTSRTGPSPSSGKPSGPRCPSGRCRRRARRSGRSGSRA